MSPSKPLLSLVTVALLAGASTPAWAQGPRPAPKVPAGAVNAALPIADMEEAAGHLIVLGPTLSFQTDRGSFSVVTFPQEAPQTVEQVLRLAREGFYSGLAFHRVVPNFAVQVGDPATRKLPVGDPKVGRGGSGHPLAPEFVNQTLRLLPGTVAMARGNDPNSADSQFFVNLAPQPSLDGAYTVWGQVLTGFDVIRKLAPGDRLSKVTVTP